MADKAKKWAVFVITERDPGRVIWTKVGQAFANRDGSFNLHLDALPLNGKLHIREVGVETTSSEQGEHNGS